MDKPIHSAELKLVLLGESSVGKSALVTRFTTGAFHKNNATIGAAFTTKVVSWETNEAIKQVKFEIWDTAGQERYRSLTPMYYRKTDVAFVVFDVTDDATFSKAGSWIDELKGYMQSEDAHDIIIKLVGNKTDLLDHVPDTTLEWTPVSAKTGEGVANLFESVAREVPSSKFTIPNEEPRQSNVINVAPSSESPKGAKACNC
ncbi:Rab family GTPase YPT10 [Lachancea thermotolerans CBS 6340]|uniref:KLTH0H10274p n=1 Tax=Lachancea thermotolerans (strain ATCC 56472 / CBS 6340 / NRRL Y-8284) TaxID=559295 RepID=C5E344_LACTC|nr:KLTH0H10274p [Lachancea thermotolerans CBS 6340]CAR30455.1 KLTH0H10274p [Lachancea thermotolerans CBS 6340]